MKMGRPRIVNSPLHACLLTGKRMSHLSNGYETNLHTSGKANSYHSPSPFSVESGRMSVIGVPRDSPRMN